MGEILRDQFKFNINKVCNYILKTLKTLTNSGGDDSQACKKDLRNPECYSECTVQQCNNGVKKCTGRVRQEDGLKQSADLNNGRILQYETAKYMGWEPSLLRNYSPKEALSFEQKIAALLTQ